MKKIILLLLLLCSFTLCKGQGMSDAQLIKEAIAAKKSGASESEIATQLMKKGATMDQIQRIRSQYAQQITKRGLDNTVDNAIGDAQARMRTNNEPNDNAITDYRTRKARVDLAYSQKLYKEAEERYEKARRSSAASNDANRRVFLDRVRSEQVKLNNEMNLKYQAYSLVAEQLRLAEAKVQEETPAFTLLQPATVPVRKAGPARARTCLIFLFLAFLATTAWVFHKEHHLIPLLFFDNEEEDYDTDDLLKALIKLSTDNQDLPKTTQSEK
jgi:hypothetical protein